MKRLLPFVILLIVLLGGVIAVPVLLNPERHRTEITALLSKLLKRPVVVGPLSMSYFPPTLRLSQVAVMKEGGTPLLEIESASAPLDWPALAHLKFAPSSLEMDRWKLMVSRKADGRWDPEDWFAGLSGNSGASSTLRQVLWKAGEVHWADPYGSAAPELVLSSISGSWDPKEGSITARGDFPGLGSPAHLTLSAKGQFGSAPQWSGDLQLSNRSDACVIRLEDKAGNWEAKGASAQWPLANALAFAKFYGRAAVKASDTAGSLELTNWQFHASGRPSEISFEHSAGISGGLIEAKGILEEGNAGLLARVDGAAKDVPAEAFWAATGQDLPLSGRVTLLAKEVQLALSSGSATIQAGQGYWELKGGGYAIPPASLNRLARAKTMVYIKKKFPDLETGGLPIQRLSAHWQVKEGLIVTDDGLLVSTDLKAGWAGKIDSARRGIDAVIRLQMHERNPKLLALIPERYQTQPAFGRLQGTWQEWTLRAVRTAKISSALQSKLRKAIR
jgi:uncharacterized protein involved in outer membrane biogenesis